MVRRFVLLDIDGVLINPAGYTKALYDTCDYLLNKLGLRQITINKEIIPVFESIGITSEWDMIPIFLLLVVDECFASVNPVNIADLKESHNFFSNIRIRLSVDKILAKVGELKTIIQPGESVCESIIRNNYRINNHEWFLNVRLFANWMITDWLVGSRGFTRSEILQIFQTHVLGSDIYREITGLMPEFESKSYLIEHDRIIINDFYRSKFQKVYDERKILSSFITARPSLHSAGFQTSNLNNTGLYFPEAELALDLLGFQEVPVVGFGPLEFVGRSLGVSGNQLVKPSPVHALTAIMTAAGFHKEEAALTAYNYFVKKINTPVIDFFSQFDYPIEISIFEDSIIGIRSLKLACDQLINDGVEIIPSCFGISEQPEKRKALENENAFIYPTINEAFSEYFSDGFA